MEKRYLLTYPHIGCGCKLEREGDTIVFGFTDSDNEKRGSAPYRPTLVVGPLLADFIHSRWNSPALGDTVEFLIPVVNLQRVAPFRLARLNESPYLKQGTMVFEMRINSVFPGFFTDPNHLVFDTGTRRLLEIHGPTLLKRKKGDNWVYAGADIYYLYKERR